jgi:hypothetical protein
MDGAHIHLVLCSAFLSIARYLIITAEFVCISRQLQSKFPLSHSSTLQRHYTENSNQIFPETKLCGLVSNSYVHVSVSDLYIPTIGLPVLLQEKKIGGPIVGIFKSLTDS